MNKKSIPQRALQPPRPQARVIIGSSQIKRTAAATSTQNRNFNQNDAGSTAPSTNYQSSTYANRNSINNNNSSNKEQARSNSKNSRLPPPASMISSNLRAVGKINLLFSIYLLSICIFYSCWC